MKTKRPVGGDSRRRCAARLAGLALVLAGVSGLRHLPSAALAQQGPTLDEQLLEGLGGEPIDEIDRELGGIDRRGIPRDAIIERPEDFQERLQRELGAAAESEDDPQLLSIARRMRDAQGRIDRADSGPGTQMLQAGIVADLDRLIDEARRIARQGQSDQSQDVTSRSPTGQRQPQPGGRQPSQRPASESEQRTERGEEPDGRPTPEALGEMIKNLWGELPEHARQQMLQTPVEEFLPKYQHLIEAYFRRLSEQQP